MPAVRQPRLAAFDVRRFEIADDDIATARADRSGEVVRWILPAGSLP